MATPIWESRFLPPIFDTAVIKFEIDGEVKEVRVYMAGNRWWLTFDGFSAYHLKSPWHWTYAEECSINLSLGGLARYIYGERAKCAGRELCALNKRFVA